MSSETERPRRVLILDTETTGLDPDTHSCIEVACALFDLRNATPLSWFSSLIYSDRNEAEEINRIGVDVLRDAPQADRVWPFVQRMAERADVIVAHRAEFDRGFVSPGVRDCRPWACSKFHIPWGKGKPGDHLVRLALAYEVPVVAAHRAMTDVDTLVRVFRRAAHSEDLRDLISIALRPRKRYIADVSYDDRELAKAAGFSWNDPIKGAWSREMRPEDADKLSFQVREVS